MDGITQALLGAVVGQACAGKQLGRRAAWWGALGGLIPDADVIASAPFGEFTSMWLHRGTSHSLWFGPVVGPLLGAAVWRFERWRAQRKQLDGAPLDLEQPAPGSPPGVNWTSRPARNAWMWLFVLSIITHPMLDVFTSYGTQLFAPFWRTRFAFDGVGIIDPIYSVTLIIALLIGRARRGDPTGAARIARWALGLTSAYLLIGLGMTLNVERRAKAELESRGYRVDSVRGYTSVFQNGLKRVVARSGEQVFVGYASGWRPSEISWLSFKLAPSSDAERVLATPEGELFAWFAQGQLSWTRGVPGHGLQSRVVEIDDIRYGMPGNPTQGMWGIQAQVDPGGNVTSVHRLRRPRAVKRGQISDIFNAALGKDARTFQVGVGGGVREVPSPAQSEALSPDN